MKIHFQGQSYSPNDAEQIKKVAPDYTFFIDFICDWVKGNQTFTFRSSGSTGAPKAIQVTREQITASVQGTASILDLSPNDQVWLCLNPDFVASLMMAARALILDMDLHITTPSSDPFKDQVGFQADFASFVPLQIYHMIANDQLGELEQIKNVLIGGAPLTPEAQQTLSSLKNNIYLSYGMTETVSHIALMNLSAKKDTYTCVKGIEILTDENSCLRVKGKVSQDLWLQTTDVIELLNDREFKWLGRVDHVINSGGIKIHPELLEKEIAPLLNQTDFFIAGIPNEQLGEQAILVTNQSISPDTFDTIQLEIEQKFSRHHIPREFYWVPKFVRTDSGKLNRKKTTELIDSKKG